jgi:hypothetical protein
MSMIGKVADAVSSGDEVSIAAPADKFPSASGVTASWSPPALATSCFIPVANDGPGNDLKIAARTDDADLQFSELSFARAAVMRRSFRVVK